MKLPTYRRPFFDRPKTYVENLRWRLTFLAVFGMGISLFYILWAFGDGPDHSWAVWLLLAVVFITSVTGMLFYFSLPVRDERD